MMKALVDKITLNVGGKEMTFSEEQLGAILEEYFSNTTETKEEASGTKQPTPPVEDEWFEVDPLAIDRSLFDQARGDKEQERTRQTILEAFAEVDANPEKYARPFKTMMPEKYWRSNRLVVELKALAEKLGDHMADWIEQALEWAQRIFNGESWKELCNQADTANWYRLVVWENGYARLVGGSRRDYCIYPASDVSSSSYGSNDWFDDTVPLVVLYK